MVASGVDAAEMKHMTWYYSTIHKNVMFLKYVHENSGEYPQQMETEYKWCNLVPSDNYCKRRKAEFETPLLGTRGGRTWLNFTY